VYLSDPQLGDHMEAQHLEELSLAEAALRLGLSWQRAWRLVLTGEIVGRKRDGRWVVDSESVERYRNSTPSNLETGGNATDLALRTVQ
jgi:hypothetical protein